MLLFKRVQCHSAVCVYGGSLVFCLHVFCISECSQHYQLLGLINVVHLLFNLYFRLEMCSPDLNIATPAPTCSDLLPSVNI